jgi:hypothetical protein
MPVYLAQEKMRKMLEEASSDNEMKLIYEQLTTFVDAVINAFGKAEDGKIARGPINDVRKTLLETLKVQKREALTKEFQAYAKQAVQQLQNVINAIDKALLKASEEDLEDLDFYFLVSTSIPLLEMKLDQHLQSFTP